MTKYLPFYLDNNGFMTNQKCFIISGENLNYLTSFLNSDVFKVCFKEYFPELQGGTKELSKVFFEKIPIPRPIEDIILSEEDVCGLYDFTESEKNWIQQDYQSYYPS